MEATEELAGDATLRRSDLQVSVDLDGETVLLHTETGQYFTMNEVGSTIWGLLDEPQTVDQLLSSVLEMFEPPEEGDQRGELLSFVTRLTSIGVLDAS